MKRAIWLTLGAVAVAGLALWILQGWRLGGFDLMRVGASFCG